MEYLYMPWWCASRAHSPPSPRPSACRVRSRGLRGSPDLGEQHKQPQRHPRPSSPRSLTRRARGAPGRTRWARSCTCGDTGRQTAPVSPLRAAAEPRGSPPPPLPGGHSLPGQHQRLLAAAAAVVRHHPAGAARRGHPALLPPPPRLPAAAAAPPPCRRRGPAPAPPGGRRHSAQHGRGNPPLPCRRSLLRSSPEAGRQEGRGGVGAAVTAPAVPLRQPEGGCDVLLLLLPLLPLLPCPGRRKPRGALCSGCCSCGVWVWVWVTQSTGRKRG